MFLFPFSFFLAFQFVQGFCCVAEVVDKPSIEIANPRKLSTSLIFVGVFHSLTAFIFSCSILTCPLPTTTPRIGISSILKLHFDHLKYKLCFSAIFKNWIVHSSNSSIVLAGMTKSSM